MLVSTVPATGAVPFPGDALEEVKEFSQSESKARSV